MHRRRRRLRLRSCSTPCCRSRRRSGSAVQRGRPRRIAGNMMCVAIPLLWWASLLSVPATLRSHLVNVVENGSQRPIAQHALPADELHDPGVHGLPVAEQGARHAYGHIAALRRSRGAGQARRRVSCLHVLEDRSAKRRSSEVRASALIRVGESVATVCRQRGPVLGRCRVGAGPPLPPRRLALSGLRPPPLLAPILPLLPGRAWGPGREPRRALGGPGRVAPWRGRGAEAAAGGRVGALRLARAATWLLGVHRVGAVVVGMLLRSKRRLAAPLRAGMHLRFPALAPGLAALVHRSAQGGRGAGSLQD